MPKLPRRGFRLDLGEQLDTELGDFCRARHRNKTQVIRELLSDYLENQLKDPETKRRVEAVAKTRRDQESKS